PARGRLPRRSSRSWTDEPPAPTPSRGGAHAKIVPSGVGHPRIVGRLCATRILHTLGAYFVTHTTPYGLLQRLCDPLSHVFASLLSRKNDLTMLLRRQLD